MAKSYTAQRKQILRERGHSTIGPPDAAMAALASSPERQAKVGRVVDMLYLIITDYFDTDSTDEPLTTPAAEWLQDSDEYVRLFPMGQDGRGLSREHFQEVPRTERASKLARVALMLTEEVGGQDLIAGAAVFTVFMPRQGNPGDIIDDVGAPLADDDEIDGAHADLQSYHRALLDGHPVT